MNGVELQVPPTVSLYMDARFSWVKRESRILSTTPSTVLQLVSGNTHRTLTAVVTEVR